MGFEASCSSSLAPPVQALAQTSSSSFPFILLIPPLYPQFPHTNSIAKLPFCPEALPAPLFSEPIRTCPFKIKPSEDPEAKPLIFYIPWTKSALQAIVKDFPKITEAPHRLAE